MTEADIQKAVFANLRSRGAPGVEFWAVPNNPASRRTVGFREGIPDVHILHQGRLYTLELKTEKGRPSEKQMEWVSRINAAKGYAFIAHGLDTALSVLECWGLIRKEAK